MVLYIGNFVLDNLNAYIEEEHHPYRRKAIKKITTIFGEVSLWHGGDLKLGQNVIGPIFKEFQDAFGEKIIAAVKNGEKEDLKNGFQILKDFSLYLLKTNPQIQDIKKLTEEINDKITITTPIKQKKSVFGVFATLKQSPFNYIIAVTVFGVVSFVVGYIGLSLGVTIGYIFTGSIALFVGLNAIFFHYIK